jgi:hypothetical protein
VVEQKQEPKETPESKVPDPKSRPRGRGGRRPGAGAPKGNLNALKHGRRSAQFAQFGIILAGNEKTRDAMLNFARRLDCKQQTAMVGAVEFHARIIEEARKIARGEPSPLEHILLDSRVGPELGSRISELGTRDGLSVQSHDAERRSIKERGPSGACRQHGTHPKTKNHRPGNQRANAISPNNQPPNMKSAPKPIDCP